MIAANKSYKQGFWKDHSAAWKASGLTQQAYCDQAGISYQSFVYQHNRLSGKLKKSVVNFIETRPELTSSGTPVSGLQVLLPNGIRIGISGEVNAGLLQTVLSIAGGIKC